MMTTPHDQFLLLLQEARADPQILGLVLTGSRGKGFGSETSDFDVLLVVRPEALETYRTRFYERESWPGFDWWVTSLPELERWQHRGATRWRGKSSATSATAS